MAGDAIGRGGEIAALLDLREILLSGSPATTDCSAAAAAQARPRAQAMVRAAYASTSGPGFLRYCSRIAAADQ